MAWHPADTGTYEEYIAKAQEYERRGLMELAKWARQKAHAALEKKRRSGR